MVATPKKAPRADARRNRERVLAVAQQVFAQRGSAATMEEIARRAGFGVGTLYRHFPTKTALLEAIVRTRLSEVVATARALETANDPAIALFTLLQRLLDESAVKKHLSDALQDSQFDWGRAAGELDVRVELQRLLERAQRAKAIRPDVSAAEVLSLLAGLLVALERFARDAKARARLFDVLCQGLRKH
jgi:AcrR family transcriptional regulator